MTDANGALVDIIAKSSAYLPLQEACFYKIKHVAEAGICPGLVDEFVVVGENSADDSLVLSLRSIEYGHAWERCRQLQAEDVVVNGKVRFFSTALLLAVVRSGLVLDLATDDSVSFMLMHTVDCGTIALKRVVVFFIF